jgi:beta-glucosidase
MPGVIGHRGTGLSYTSFDYSDLQVKGGDTDTVTVTFTITNTGDRQGADVPQVYLTEAPDGPRMRLLGFERVELEPGESRKVTVTADPRLLARFDGDSEQWHIAKGTYQIAVGIAANALDLTGETELTEALFGS